MYCVYVLCVCFICVLYIIHITYCVECISVCLLCVLCVCLWMYGYKLCVRAFCTLCVITDVCTRVHVCNSLCYFYIEKVEG